MLQLPEPVAQFLRGKRFAIAGVSRDKHQPGNAVYRKLRGCGYDVFPVNPRTDEVEGVKCYHDLASVPGPIDGVFAATPPRAGLELVRSCETCGVKQLWFHRSFGQGSVSDEAVRECQARGIHCIVGGCPMMYSEPVDPAHRCFRFVFRMLHRIPG